MNVRVNLICFLVFLAFVNGFFVKANGFDLDRVFASFKIPKSEMASSQVEFASSAPFGCVLRDHNRRERCTRDSSFQKNLKDLVRDHLHTCISNSDENTQNEENCTHKSDELQPPDGRRRPRSDEIENSPPQSESSVEIPNLGGVSSLVQRWRNFADAKIIKKLGVNANAIQNPNPNASSSAVRSTSGASSISCPESALETADDERFDTPSTMTEDSFVDWESDRLTPSGPPSAQSSRVDSEEKERLRVADVIRKLTSENQMQGCLMSWKSEPERIDQPLENESLPRLRVARDCNQPQEPNRCLFAPIVNSSKIRGRQAFSDLLMQLERDRLRELDGLMERRVVSKFSHRGRIQACLRLRFMLREAANQQHVHPMPSGSKQHSRREKAKTPTKKPSYVKVVDPQPSNSTAVGPQKQLCCEKVLRDQSSSCEVGSQQHGDLPVVRNQQHSGSEVIDRDQRNSRGGESVPRDRLQLQSTASESRPPKQSSAIILLREKFDARIENEASDVKTLRGVKVNEAPAVCSSSNQLREELPHHQERITTDQQSAPSVENSVSRASEDVPQPATANTDNTCPGTSSLQDCNNDPQGDAVEGLSSSNGREDIMMDAEEGKDINQNLVAANEDMTSEDQQPTFHEVRETEQDWMSDASHPWTEWYEDEDNDDHMIGTNPDWITDIARPRSDWEDLRQARYQEMLDPYTENEDIRRLLERRSVSTFLTSNLRESMDQLMMSRMEILPQAMQTRQDNQGFNNSLEQLMMSHIQRQAQHTINIQQTDEEEHEEEEGDQEEHVEELVTEEEGHNVDELEGRTVEHHHQYGEMVDSYLNQAPGDSRPWSGPGEASYDSDQVSSPSLQQPLSSHSSHPDRPFSSCTNRSSMEMELMYYFRGHMEQLHQEMLELRKSINSCVNMQEEMQKSIKQEVAAALNQSVREARKESHNGLPKKGCCCICYEVKVDCLLYRCGHMCTCFKCALELQWSSGKCPICRAPIVDVVRAYADT